jgi:hypothetical protein
MSRRARAYRDAYEAKHNPDAWEPDWRDERDSDEIELPERDDEPLPSNTLH